MPSSDAASWYEALTLGERLAGLRLEARADEPPLDTDRARQRLEDWRAQAPFSEDGYFARRLARAGIDDDALWRLLGESAEQLRARQRQPPNWLREITAAFKQPLAPVPLAWPPTRNPKARHTVAFLNLVEPLVRRGLRRLRRRLQRLVAEHHPDLLFAPETIELLLLDHLSERLRGALVRIVVLEMHIAKLEEELRGETPQERFGNFVADLRQPERAREILQRYPVLARRATRRIDQWIDASLEFLIRLQGDRELILRHFSPRQDPGVVSEIHGGLSDPHRDGRSVLKVEFTSGLRLVYKPKPLAVEVAFQDLLTWLDERGLEPALRKLDAVDRGDYGWVSFVDAEPCHTQDQVRRFYQRQGAYLALLYFLGATDFHHENLIASGEHPMLIDLETLFQPPVWVRDPGQDDRQPGVSLDESVLRIGLLPQRLLADEVHAGIDVSGLGTAAGQVTQPLWGPVDEGTDQMRFERRPQAMPGAENRPTLNGEDVQLTAYSDDITAGFARLYRLLMSHRDGLLAADGPLATFAQVSVRVVFRPTQAYAQLLIESFHPHVLGSAIDQARLFDRLWGGVEERPFLEQLIAAEQRDLERGDVPLFTTRPGSRDLWTSDGDRLASFVETTGLERAERRLRRLSPADLERQMYLIRESLHVVEMEERSGVHHSHILAPAATPAPPSALLTAACEVGERLATLAFREPRYAHWQTLQKLGLQRWTLQPAGPDLYTGLPGIALFLGHLGKLTATSRYTSLARAAIATQRYWLEHYPDAVTFLGAYTGWGGLVYAHTQLAALWDDPTLLDEAESWVASRSSQIATDRQYGLVSGVAGFLAAILGLYDQRPSAAIWQAALACGEHLLAQAQEMESGIGWVVETAGARPLTGMSHGAAGIALALLRLWKASADARFLSAAHAAIAYERSLYSSEEHNWPDLREASAARAESPSQRQRYLSYWCHGAPGIGLARLAGLPDFDDAEVREEIAIAIDTTLAHGFGDSHSLCHGDLGNLDFLLEAARALHDPELSTEVYRLARSLLDSKARNGWRCGLPAGAEPQGLMVGLAGIGYGLLRLADPDRVPCVLSLSSLTSTRGYVS